jgi:hypothetical protein
MHDLYNIAPNAAEVILHAGCLQMIRLSLTPSALYLYIVITTVLFGKININTILAFTTHVSTDKKIVLGHTNQCEYTDKPLAAP